jgi:hypothetical protein
MKIFTSKGLPEVWYPLCGGSFDCVSITQKTSRKKLGQCKKCRYSESRIWARLFGLELSGEPVYGDVADMLINRNNPSFWKRRTLSGGGRRVKCYGACSLRCFGYRNRPHGRCVRQDLSKN